MKQRIISAVIGLGVLAVVLVLFNTIALNIVIALLGLLAVGELLHATGCTENRLLTVISLVSAAVMPFLTVDQIQLFAPVCGYFFVLALFGTLLHDHEHLRVEKVALGFFFAIIIPCTLYGAIYLRNRFAGGSLGLFYLLMALGAAWLSDSGAYFAGRAFGKHKMAPKVSPKKTVEGLIGGVVVCVLSMLLMGWLYGHISAAMGEAVTINYINILICAPILSLSGVMGDLSASVIKRQFGVKDYGKIMPGHGGVMDRFDSVLFVLPLMLLCVRFLPFAALL